MDIEAPLMVDGVAGRQSHSGSRLATETGCVALPPCGHPADAIFFFTANVYLENLKLSPLQVSQAEEVAVQLPLTTIQAQALALQRAPSPLPPLSLARAQRQRKRARAATERPSAIQGRDTQW